MNSSRKLRQMHNYYSIPYPNPPYPAQGQMLNYPAQEPFTAQSNYHPGYPNFYQQPNHAFSPFQEQGNHNQMNPYFENPLQQEEYNPYQMKAMQQPQYANPYPKASFMNKPPSTGVNGIMNSFKSQDGSFDFNKVMNTTGQLMGAVNQVSSLVKGLGGIFKL
ncbi:YppG family protein [Rossellomorea aquimaris]|uniref:YppG family protein n=1 Tax=Rossellomorea aquimaris TaxID=189382 RepID=UPI0009EE89CE|nr:YppG family protein [Rossellomorea aquimaris]